MAGTLTISSLSDGTNTGSVTDSIKGSARAWVNFSTNGSTCTVNASYNISSVTVVTGAVYQVNFSAGMADANYLAVGMGCHDNTGGQSAGFTMNPLPAGNSNFLKTTSAVRVANGTSGGTFTPIGQVGIAVFR